MKKSLVTLIASFLVLLPGSVLAATTPSPATTPATSSTDTLQQRVDKRKNELKLSLSSAEKTNLANKCKASQAVLAKLQARVVTLQGNRTKYYTDMFTKISAVQAKLREQAVDTTQIDAAVSKYISLVTQFNSDLATYKQNIDDATAMECTKDVTGFKSILEAARTGRTTLIKDSADVTAQLGAIKSVLSSLKAAQATEKK
jgi:hypothetical protein